MAMSDEQRFYGQLIVDFANAASTDEAGLKYFENIQKAFGFPPQFSDKAKNIFPIIKGFDASLSEPEKQCLNLIAKMKMIELEISSFLECTAVKYDAYLKMFHVRINQEIILGYSSIEGCLYDEPIIKDLSIEELKEMIRSVDLDPFCDKDGESIIFVLLPKFLILGEKITSFKEISKERYGQLSELEAAYEYVQDEHRQIEGIQDDLKTLLREIVKPECKGDSEAVNGILSRYNDRNTISDPPIKNEPPDKKIFDEAYFLDRNNFHDDFNKIYDLLYKIYGLPYKIYNLPIDCCVNEFLGVVENLEYLKECELCGKFYIANRLIERQKRCSICSKKTRLTREAMADYMRKYRPQQKARREAEIKKHIAKGLTRRQAVEFLKKRKPTNRP